MALLDEIQFRVYRSYVKIPLIFFVPALALMSLFSLAYFHLNSWPTWRLIEQRLHQELGGDFSVGYIRFAWTLTGVEVFDVEIASPEGDPVIEAKRVRAALHPLMLLSRRLEFQRGQAEGVRVRIAIDEEGDLSLLKAFGVYDRLRTGDDDEEEKAPLAVGFSDISIADAEFEFVDRRFDFRVEQFDIPRGEVFIEPATVLMAVDALEVPLAKFRFRPELFYFPPERGDWEFHVRDFSLRNWRWANEGFTVEHFEADVDGIGLKASGRMAFPSEGERTQMLYDARATIQAAYESTLFEYFTHGHIRFALSELEAHIQGSRDEIYGSGTVYAPVIQGAGLFFEEIDARVRLENRFVLAEELRGKFYEAEIEAENAFFNILETVFGADVVARGLNPRPMVLDMVGQDQPFLDGAMDGKVRIIGEIPGGAEPGPQTLYALQRNVMSRFLEFEVLEPLEFRRNNSLLFPNQELTMSPGARLWIDQRRLGLPRATVLSGGDRVDLEDFYLEMGTLFFNPPGGRGPAHFNINLGEIAPYATYYGLDGLEGPARGTMTMEGFFGSPEWKLSAFMPEPAWRLGTGEIMAGESLSLKLSAAQGEIEIEEAHLDADFGKVDVVGRAGWFEPPPMRGGPQPWPIWEFRRVQPLELDIKAESVALEAISDLIHPALMARGPMDGQLKLEGTMQELQGSFEATVHDGEVRGQGIAKASARGELLPGGVLLEHALVDLGEGGLFVGEGRYGYDESFEFKLEGEGVDLEEIEELKGLPMQLGGRGRFHLDGEGDLSDPVFSGGAQARDLSVDGRVFGDVAFALDTLDGVVYVSGGLLPWLSASLELPLRGDAPFYARLGMEELALMEFLPELRDHPMLDEAQVTGMAELFFERDFSRYQAIFYLTNLEVDSKGQLIRNRGPVIIGYNNGEVLTFQRATFGSRGRYFSLEGGIAFDPTLLDLRLEGDVDLSLLQSVRAGFPEFFPDFFVEANGYALADMNVRGTPENFVAHGTIDFGPSEWELRFLPEPVVIRDGKMVFGDHGIFIPQEHPIRGTLLGGATRVAGEIGYLANQPRTLNMQMWSHNMSYRIPELATLAFDTNLTLRAEDWQDWASWVIGGELSILDGTYTQRIQLVEQALTGRVFGAFQRRADRYEAGLFETVPILNDIRFDLFVRARDGFRLQSHVDRLELDLEFRFDLLLRDTLVKPRISGEIDVIGGTVAFQGERFEVRSGTVRFQDDVSNPYLDIVAGADVRNTCRESDLLDEMSPTMMLSSNMDATGMQFYHIIMNIRGELQNLDLHMESNPYADQRDILSLLLTGCTVDQLTASSASRPTLEIALGPLLGRLEREIQDVVAVEEFTIMPGVERTQLRIGDRLTRRLSWRFQLDTGFEDATGGQHYQLEYKLSDRWSAEMSERSQTETNNFLIDLKLKYRLPLD